MHSWWIAKWIVKIPGWNDERIVCIRGGLTCLKCSGICVPITEKLDLTRKLSLEEEAICLS